MALIAIDSLGMRRIDDRLSTLSNTSYIECGIPSANPAPVFPALYGTVLVGLTGTIDREMPLILRVKKVYDFGIYVHIDELFPRGLPPGYADLLWDCWYVPRRVGYSLGVLGVQP